MENIIMVILLNKSKNFICFYKTLKYKFNLI